MKNLSIPVAIIIAGVIIAGAVYFSGGKTAPAITDNKPVVVNQDEAKEKIKIVSDEDHFFGNPDAPVTVIEYSDTECPYCKRFHQTMEKIMNEYGKDGKVKWVYRHFPLDVIHKKSRTEAMATECAFEQAGNEKFWALLNKIYEITPSNDGFDLSKLPALAEELGLNKDNFEKCLSENRYANKIENDFQNGANAGIEGTPYSLVINKKGESSTIEGAYPYEEVKASIDKLLLSNEK